MGLPSPRTTPHHHDTRGCLCACQRAWRIPRRGRAPAMGGLADLDCKRALDPAHGLAQALRHTLRARPLELCCRLGGVALADAQRLCGLLPVRRSMLFIIEACVKYRNRQGTSVLSKIVRYQDPCNLPVPTARGTRRHLHDGALARRQEGNDWTVDLARIPRTWSQTSYVDIHCDNDKLDTNRDESECRHP